MALAFLLSFDGLIPLVLPVEPFRWGVSGHDERGHRFTSSSDYQPSEIECCSFEEGGLRLKDATPTFDHIFYRTCGI